MAKFESQTHYSDILAKKTAAGSWPADKMPSHLRVTDAEFRSAGTGRFRVLDSRFDNKK